MPLTSHRRPSRRDMILRLLDEAEEPLTIAEMATELDVHPNTVRFHLDRLLQDGLVVRTTADSGTPGRPAQLFRRSPVSDDTGQRRYRALAEVLIDEVAHDDDPEASALDAGRRWGAREAAATTPDDPIRGLVEVLGSTGFSPERDGGDVVTLHHCPFLELADGAPGIVCAIHLGLMQGALRAWDADVDVDRLERHRMPGACIAHLSATRTPATRPVLPESSAVS